MAGSPELVAAENLLADLMWHPIADVYEVGMSEITAGRAMRRYRTYQAWNRRHAGRDGSVNDIEPTAERVAIGRRQRMAQLISDKVTGQRWERDGDLVRIHPSRH